MPSDRDEHGRPASDQARIVVIQDGPYEVSGSVPLAEQIIGIDQEGDCHGWRQGRQFPTQETYSLCRCGRSQNPPYCDGSHFQVDFDGSETASREPYQHQAGLLEGPELDLADSPDLCARARFCHRAGGIWDLTEQSDDPVSRRTAIEEAQDCPSGRLVAMDKAGNALEPELEPSIGVTYDPQLGERGPLWVRGGVTIVAADGTPYERRNRVTLCRCGRSGNKPFCDGSHRPS
jgi:CDGSH-type Zn-finger protein